LYVSSGVHRPYRSDPDREHHDRARGSSRENAVRRMCEPAEGTPTDHRPTTTPPPTT
jgi:hypothetical protein